MAVSRGGEAAGGKLAGSDPLGSKAAGEVRIDDTQRPLGELIVHLGEVVSGELRQGDEVELSVDGERRQAIRRNHSATHLLHHALRSTLGTHVAQKGSLVAADRLRFDFSHFAPLSDDERRRVENAVNRAVLANQEVRTAVCSYDQARQRGAMALFGEKYGERVRMVQIGEESVELCGGTHVARSGDIGLFRLLSESGIAQGVRRIEAVTGLGALELWRRTEAELTAAARVLRGGLFEVEARVGRLQRELRERERELGELSRKLAGGNGHDPLEAVREVGGVRVLASRVELRDPRALREIGDKLRDRLESGVLALGGVADGKVSLLVMVTKDLVGRLHAGELVAAAAAEVGGRGGGRPDMAQAGGSQPERLDAALDRVVAMVGERAGE
jgi:alanyl-tRNA synthetase